MQSLGNGGSACVSFMLKTSRFRPTWCILHRVLKTIWGNFQTADWLQFEIPIFERNEMSECPRKPRQPTSIGITWDIQPFSTQSECSVSCRFFFCLCTFLRFSSQGTVNSMRRTVFFESNQATTWSDSKKTVLLIEYIYIYIYMCVCVCVCVCSCVCERERERGSYLTLTNPEGLTCFNTTKQN